MILSDTDDSVLKAQNEGLDDVLTDARELYEQVKLADLRSDQAIQEFVAGVAMVIREARREPDQFDAECKTAEIKRGNKRLEVCATRLAANDPHLAKPRWASAAAYLAERVVEAPTRSAATELIRRTPNGITGLAELHAARTTPEPEPVALTEWADAQLDGIGPDAIVDDLAALEGDGHSYRLILEKQMPDGSSRVWLLSESDGFGEPTIRRAVKKVKSRVILQHGPSRYADPSVGPRLDRAERLAASVGNQTEPGMPDGDENDDEQDEPGGVAAGYTDRGENGDAEEPVSAERQLQGAVVPAAVSDDHCEPKSIGSDIRQPKASSKPVRLNKKPIVVPESNRSRPWGDVGVRHRRFDCRLASGACEHEKGCKKHSRCIGIGQPVTGRALAVLGHQ